MLIDALLSGQRGAFLDALRHLILPAIVLGTVPLGVIARMTRSSMLEVLNEDYVRTARAKGLSPFRVIGVHALRNALLPVVTVIGLSVSGLLAGAVLTETIFSWPGVGKWLIESISRRDYPALQGGVMLVSDGGHPRQPARRSRLRRDQSEDPPWPLTSPLAPALPAEEAIASVLAQPSPLAAFWAAFRENSGAVFGLVVICLVVAAGAWRPISSRRIRRSSSSATRCARRRSGSAGGTWRFALGTDGDGHDMLSRLIFGARVSLFIGLSVMSVSFVIGVVLGLIAAMAGPLVDVVITRVMDLIMAVPSLVLAILVVAVLGPSLANTIVAVTIVYLPRYVRLVRASALGELNKDYVTAARVAGVGPLRLMVATVLPNCLAPLIVQAALGVSERHSRGGGPRLPGPRRAAADPGMGHDARRFARVHPLRSLDRRRCPAWRSSSPSSRSI